MIERPRPRPSEGRGPGPSEGGVPKPLPRSRMRMSTQSSAIAAVSSTIPSPLLTLACLTALVAASETARAMSSTIAEGAPWEVAKSTVARRKAVTVRGSAAFTSASDGRGASPAARSSWLLTTEVTSGRSLIRRACHLTRLALALDDHEVPLVALDDFVDQVDLVPGDDQEAVEVRPHVLVGGDRQINGLRAAQVTALANEAGAVGVLLAPLDRLVDLAAVGLPRGGAPTEAVGLGSTANAHADRMPAAGGRQTRFLAVDTRPQGCRASTWNVLLTVFEATPVGPVAFNSKLWRPGVSGGVE